MSDGQVPPGTGTATAREPLPAAGPGVRQATVSVGMAVALGAITMTFAALFLAYAIVRVQAPAWPPPGELTLPRGWWTAIWLASATLAALTGSAALRVASRASAERAPLLLAITAAAGVIFIATQLTAWTRLASDGFRPSSGLVASVVYALTLFHAVHAAVALALLVPLLGRAIRGLPRRASTFAAVSSFWHLVTVVWLAVAVAVFVA